MPRRFAPYLLVVALNVVLASSADPLGAAEVVEKLNEYMEACAKVKKFSGSVLVAKDDETLLSKGYGHANLEHGVANTPVTKFRIGSITKQFTSMAVMLLQDRGKLNVEDAISMHIPESPDAWSPVTIHHLLTHTSGIPSYTGMAEYGRDMMLPQSGKQMLDRFRDKPLRFAPGEEFRYSNSGYFLLGVIIENVSGQSYEQFLEREVFEPLGLHDTGYDHRRTILKNRASGYERQANELVHAPYLDMSQPYAAGSLYSTVEDLSRWDRALRDRKLLSAEGYAKLFTPEKRNYAYGWQVRDQDGHKSISHGGGINGFRSQILRLVDNHLCIVVLSNAMPANPSQVANDLAAIVLGKKYEVPQIRKFTQVDPQILDTYNGRYEISQNFILTVTREGDSLIVQPTGQPPATLKAESDTVFFVEAVDAQLTFVAEDGKVMAVVLKQAGQVIRGNRIEEKP